MLMQRQGSSPPTTKPQKTILEEGWPKKEKTEKKEFGRISLGVIKQK
jgi:hypothetical protein